MVSCVYSLYASRTVVMLLFMTKSGGELSSSEGMPGAISSALGERCVSLRIGGTINVGWAREGSLKEEAKAVYMADN